jgi:hypothetical protein
MSSLLLAKCAFSALRAIERAEDAREPENVDVEFEPDGELEDEEEVE